MNCPQTEQKCMQLPGKKQVSVMPLIHRESGCCLKYTLTSGPPTLSAPSSSWFAPQTPDLGTKKTKGWANKPGIYPLNLTWQKQRFWFGRSQWAHNPERKNMIISVPRAVYSCRRGGTKAEDGWGPLSAISTEDTVDESGCFPSSCSGYILSVCPAFHCPSPRHTRDLE